MTKALIMLKVATRIMSVTYSAVWDGFMGAIVVTDGGVGAGLGVGVSMVMGVRGFQILREIQ